MTADAPITLAEKLGRTAPASSALLAKAASRGLSSAALLESLAVARGCSHYDNHLAVPSPVVSEDQFSNEELAVALLSAALPYSPHTIRVGAAMLGAAGNRPEELAKLAEKEGSVGVVASIARAAQEFEPTNPIWRRLIDCLPPAPVPPDGVMPHPTRFVSMTGMTRAGREKRVVWIRPAPQPAGSFG
jgi:hypothetical protein